MMMMIIRRNDGGTNFILRIKEQETRLNLQEYDYDNEPMNRRKDQIHHEDQGIVNTPNPSGI